ncbi:uncharacterized protein LOC8078071 [Sorghum bicolor]|nr:uncharacterized protein LOC8078071 [Sorghum bicolor]XP_021312162.1 uncharacterized protein LOC8078071 [Sorghum bicolor]KXG31449.1 hypothetical protein SORBI_3003G002000 [Sorghum bicolor]|eukprot:XP_021312161.1 uncharacterized protein LOC8078071 [Sorghum bicolor]
MPSPSEPPRSSWVILGAIPRVSAAAANPSIDLAAPPRISLLTIPKRIFPDKVTPHNYPKLLAADPSGLLLLHADQGRAKGPTIIDRPDHQSFCWLANVAGYFVLHANADSVADPSALALPEPELVMNAGHLGILASPDGSGYVVAELQTFLGDDHATLISFSSDVGEWVDKTVDYPLPARPLGTHGVVALHGRLWWVDLSWCLVACDPCSDKPVLAVVPLPPAKEIPYGQAAGVIHRYRAVRVSAGRLCFVDMYRNRDSRGGLQVSVWTLPDADSTEWALEHEASFTDIWEHHTYKAAGLPAKIPVLALIHPDDPAVVYFFLEDHLVGVDLRDRAVVACDLYHLVDPPRNLVSTRFVYAWQLPQPLSRSPPDFAKESTEDGPDDVAATLASSVNI